jgi:restriction system protein
MGAFSLRRIELVTSLNELVGYKAGIALTHEQMCIPLSDEDSNLFKGEVDARLRVRSEHFAELLARLLYSVGNIKSPDAMPGFFSLEDKFKHDKILFPIYCRVNNHLLNTIEEAMDSPVDFDQFLKWAAHACGPQGAKIAQIIIETLEEDRHKSPLIPFRRFEWKNVEELNNLFNSEQFKTPHGEFFDQRYIDYLSHNFESVDAINWRQFEGLTCEFFHRLGLKVEIGKGRNDDGIDARIWAKDPSAKTPLLLVQCKRQKDSIEKVVVKALYADILQENAKAGLVVTTHRLSPGARQVCSGRNYPVAEANRDTLRAWVNAMRTPYSGIFLGE